MLRFALKPRHPVTKVAFTADGRELVTAQPFTGITVRDRLTGAARLYVPMYRTAHFARLEVHPSLGGMVVHASKRAELLDPVSGLHREVLESRASVVQYVPEMLTGQQMWWRGSSTGERLQLQARERGGPIVALGRHEAALASRLRQSHIATGVNVIRFAPDGTKVAIGCGGTMAVFDLQRLEVESPVEGRTRTTLHPLFTLEQPDPTRHGTHADKNAEHWLPPVAFDHAGRTMFTLGLRNRVQRIDLATGGVIAEWGWRCEPIRSLAVAPDDLTAAAGCQRGEVVLWDLE